MTRVKASQKIFEANYAQAINTAKILAIVALRRENNALLKTQSSPPKLMLDKEAL